MKIASTGSGFLRPKSAGFTLAEVVVALVIATATFGGIILGYVKTAERAEWSAFSLAAHSLAMQGVEAARAAQWDPRVGIDKVISTNLVDKLDVPYTGGSALMATTYVTVTNISVDPPLKQLRADCVWYMPSRRGKGTAGPFTNTVITLRAPDQ